MSSQVPTLKASKEILAHKVEWVLAILAIITVGTPAMVRRPKLTTGSTLVIEVHS